ncbi:MAG: hypothetical protein COB23_02005 [Methylophaga sp.]|nr:MAG: hypothetical protein COB23_02005 [Methylophaga sp.]
MKTLDYQTTPEIQKVIAAVARTEDVKFSSDGKYFAIVDFTKNKVHIFEIKIADSSLQQKLEIVSCVTISSEHLKRPHGLIFVGDKHFLVANRAGDITIFKFPEAFSGQTDINLMPVRFVRGRRFYGKISSPGSIGCYQIGENSYRLLVLNNYLHTIVGFDIKISEKIQIKNRGVLIKKGLDIPDGISISPNKKWAAVSNHYTGSVLIYRLSPFLNRFTSAAGTLIDIAYPHGLRFSADGKKLFVADAGSQYLHVYESDNEDWSGTHKPLKSIKLVDKAAFLKGRINTEEGGLKGLDLINNDQLLVTTAQHQVLKFYAVNALLDIPISSVEQYLVKEKMKYYRALEKGVRPEPENE